MHDQADELRQLVLRHAAAGSVHGPAAPLVVISGGKGGVGATTIAVNLAVALARHGRRAVFVDADLDHGGNTRFGSSGQRASVVDVLAGRSTVHEALERGPSGIQVLSGAWASQETVEVLPPAQDRFIEQLAGLSPHAEVVVVDAGSSRGQLARRFWQAACAVVVVTTTDDAAILQSYAAIKVLGTDIGVPIHTQVNRGGAAGDVQARLAEACHRFLGLRTLPGGNVVECSGPAACEPLLVFAPRSEAARSMDRLADTLWAQVQLDAARRSFARRAAVPAT